MRPVAELAVMTRLYDIATRFVHDSDLQALLYGALEEAIAILGADAGYIVLAGGSEGARTVAAHLGLDEPDLDRLASSLHKVEALAASLEVGERVVVENIEESDELDGPGRDALVALGVRSLQATRLRSRSGNVVGFLCTHHTKANRLSEHDLGLLHLLARQCADAIERTGSGDSRGQPTAADWVDKVRETETLFRTTVDNMPVNLVLCNREGRPLYFNSQLAAMVAAICKRPADEVIGLPGAEVWPPPIWNPLRAHIERAIATGERQTYELGAELPNGQRMVRQWTVVPLIDSDGEVRRILAMSHDITAQRRLVDELREADRRKSEFIAVLSHELRNPLGAIRTSLHILEHEKSGIEDIGRARKIIDRQVNHLVRLVEDLLDVTRIAQNKIRLRRGRVDVNDLARETIEDTRAHFDTRGVRLEAKLAGSPLHVYADRARVSQVLMNLLSNAAKFTPSGGTTTVSVSADDERRVVLTVADDGSGIEPALLPRVFEPFVQGDRTLDRSGGGLGVGLALVKGLVELHGGDVRARSRAPDVGTEFVVRLPLEEEAPAQPIVSPSESPALVPRRVLVIEDDRDIAYGLHVALNLDGHPVEVAFDGHEGLEKARVFKPDLVLCDVGLPGMSGYEVAQAIKADSTLRSTYLVALSGYAQAEDIEAARSAGFDQHVAKPASMEKIQKAIADSLKKTDLAEPR